MEIVSVTAENAAGVLFDVLQAAGKHFVAGKIISLNMGIGQNGKVKKAGIGIPHVVCGVTADADREQYDPGKDQTDKT